MLEDARQLPPDTRLTTDVCIIGAGAAGITLGLSLAGSSTQAIILESGGATFERAPQRLNKGVNAGVFYEALNLCRVRGFGGSTGPQGWGGWCKPLTHDDFARRSWVPMSGWPLTHEDFEGYYERAYRALGLPADTPLIAASEASSDQLLPTNGTSLHTELSALSPASAMGVHAGVPLKTAPNIRVLLYANATNIETDRDARSVRRIDVATVEGNTFSVSARYFVLAAGGIENPRLLLLSNKVQSNGLGNGSDFVGRCFMEHPRFSWGRLEGEKIAQHLRHYNPVKVVRARTARQASGVASSSVLFGAGLALKPEIQRREEILNARSWILPVPEGGEREGGRELKELVFWLKKRRVPADIVQRSLRIGRHFPSALETISAHFAERAKPPRFWQFITVLEQEPSLSSRVTLERSRDALGLNRVNLQWRLGPLVEKTLQVNRRLLVENLRQAGINSSTIWPGKNAQHDKIEQEPRWVWHHMGTTRMSENPAHGVVDRNCRVHGMGNLFIAGSSIFPTGGNDMPTLTIVALAYRLADHLKSCLSRREDAPVLEPKLELVAR